MIDAGMSARLSLDFSNAEIWSYNPNTGERLYLGWGNAFNLGLDWSHVSSIGFSIAGDFPLDGEDHNFRVEAAPAPEPTSLVFIGCGLLGLAILRRKFRKSSNIS